MRWFAANWVIKHFSLHYKVTGSVYLSSPCEWVSKFPSVILTLCFFFLLQNTPVGTPIYIVNATDPDQGTGGSVLYSIQPSSNFFAIDKTRGIVTVMKELDFEITQAYQLQVNATVRYEYLMEAILFLHCSCRSTIRLLMNQSFIHIIQMQVDRSFWCKVWGITMHDLNHCIFYRK